MADEKDTGENGKKEGKKIHPSKNRIKEDKKDNVDKIPETTTTSKEDEVTNPETKSEETSTETTTQQEESSNADSTKQEETSAEYQPVIEPEPDIKSDAELLQIDNESKDYSPNSEQRIERDYAKADMSGEKAVDRVEEVVISKETPPIRKDDGSGSSEKKSTTAPSAEKTLDNPDMVGLTKEEQVQNSTMLVDALLGGYRQLWGGIAWLTTVGDNQVMQWIMKGDLSDDMTIPFGADGKTMTVQEFYKEFDEAVTEAGELPEDHFAPVRDSMIREFTRRGWGLSDMQNIAQFFARDAVQRSGNFYALYRQRVANTNQLFELWKQQKEILDKQNEIINNQNAGTTGAKEEEKK